MISIETTKTGGKRAVATINGKVVASYAGKQPLGDVSFFEALQAAYAAELDADAKWREILAAGKAAKAEEIAKITRRHENDRDSYGNDKWSDE